MQGSVSRLKRVQVTLALTIIAIVAAALPGYGQTVAVAEVSGLVSDQSGAAVPGTLVRMIETDKQAAHTLLTDPQGRYVLPNLPGGAVPSAAYRRRASKTTCRRDCN